jgi:predicted RNase H-like HicB family nuclease
MQYQVFVKNPAEREFMASVIGLPNVTANGITEKDANEPQTLGLLSFW